MPAARLPALAHNRSFVAYVSGQALSAFGNNLYPVAVLVGVFELTHSAISSGAVLAAEAVPGVVLALVGGALADRLPRQRVMLVADLVRAVAQGTLAMLFLIPHPSIVAIVLTQAVYGIGTAFFAPAAAALLADIVDDAQLTTANSTMSFVESAARIVVPLLAGLVVAFGGSALAVVIDAASFLFSSLTLAFIPVVSNATRATAPSIRTQVRDGLRAFTHAPWVLVLTAYFAVLTSFFNAPILVLGPVVALQRFGGPIAWSVLISCFGAGMLAASLVAPRTAFRHPLPVAYAAMLLAVPFYWTLATADVLWLPALCVFIAGLVGSFFTIVTRTVVQRSVERAVLSRVASLMWLSATLVTPIAFSAMGIWGARSGASTVLEACGVVVITASICAFVLSLTIARTRTSTPT